MGEFLIWGLIVAIPVFVIVNSFYNYTKRVKDLENKVFELEKEAKANEIMIISNKNRIDRLDGGR